MRLVTAELFLCFAHIPFEASIVSFNSQKYDVCDIVRIGKTPEHSSFFQQICDTVSQLQYVATSNDCTYYYLMAAGEPKYISNK